MVESVSFPPTHLVQSHSSLEIEPTCFQVSSFFSYLLIDSHFVYVVIYLKTSSRGGLELALPESRSLPSV
jgi:hypothetical protein